MLLSDVTDYFNITNKKLCWQCVILFYKMFICHCNEQHTTVLTWLFSFMRFWLPLLGITIIPFCTRNLSNTCDEDFPWELAISFTNGCSNRSGSLFPLEEESLRLCYIFSYLLSVKNVVLIWLLLLLLALQPTMGFSLLSDSPPFCPFLTQLSPPSYS